MTTLEPPKTEDVDTAQGWKPDPSLPGRLRYHDGSRWTDHVSANGETYEEPYLGEGHCRWQFGVINIGLFSAYERMAAVLGAAGETGWQLITVFDKQSNWNNWGEKGFMLFRRPVPPGVRLEPHQWCISLSTTYGG